MNEEEILQLEKTVSDLIDWKNSRMEERFTYPLNSNDKKILDYWITPNSKGLPFATGTLLTPFADLIEFGFEFSINGQRRYLGFTLRAHIYTVDPDTDIFTSSEGAHSLDGTLRIAINTTIALPTPIDSNIPYYPVNITPTTFKISLTKGGLPIDITSKGVGTQYYFIL